MSACSNMDETTSGGTATTASNEAFSLNSTQAQTTADKWTSGAYILLPERIMFVKTIKNKNIWKMVKLL